MIRPLELFIGLRYTRAKRRNHFISFISLMATLGIVLGVAALITVLSVMNGFGKELRSRILGVVSHVTVTEADGRLQDWRAVLKETIDQAHVMGRAPYVQGQGMLVSEAASLGVLVRGILPNEEPKVSELGNKMTEGSLAALRAGAYGIIVGTEIAWRLDLDLGSYVSLVASATQVTPAGLLPRFKRFRVVGIFEVGMADYDGGLVLMHMDDAARLYRTGGRVSGIRLKLDDLFLAPVVKRNLTIALGDTYHVRDWSEEQASFFRALRIEKTAMFIIMMLVIAVAAFNIVSMLVMLVTDKEADIAILRTLGLSPGGIMRVFMIHGALLGIVGTLAGAIGGVLLAENIGAVVNYFERLLDAHLFTEDIYYYSGLVADLHWSDVVVIIVASFLVSILATVYPARRAARVEPAVALHTE